jgi:predicted transcriptional regulator
VKKGGAKKAREAVLRINSYLSEMETFQSEMAIWEARRKEALAAIDELHFRLRSSFTIPSPGTTIDSGPL